MDSSVLESLRNDGYAIVRNVIEPEFLGRYLEVLREESSRRIREGESDEDVRAAKETGHNMMSFEKNSYMDGLLDKVIHVLNEVVPRRRWVETNRQIVWQTKPDVPPMSFHVDGLSRIFKEGWENTWPGFRVLAGIPLVEVSGAGQGGLLVRHGSHREVIELYKEVLATADHLEALKTLQQWQTEQKEAKDGILLHVNPGDLVLCHSLMAHRPDWLHSPYSLAAKIYFRLMDPEEIGPEALNGISL